MYLGLLALRFGSWWIEKPRKITLQETIISHLGKRKVIFKYALSGGYVNSLEGKIQNLKSWWFGYGSDDEFWEIPTFSGSPWIFRAVFLFCKAHLGNPRGFILISDVWRLEKKGILPETNMAGWKNHHFFIGDTSSNADWSIVMLGFQRCNSPKSWCFSLKPTSPLKMDGWKMILSFWGQRLNFRGQTRCWF